MSAVRADDYAAKHNVLHHNVHVELIDRREELGRLARLT
jgi:hypothetical protein